jgi:hypothetical protein
MALTAGIVSIDESGNITGSGLALAIAQQIFGSLPASLLAMQVVRNTWPAFPVELATAIVTYLTENAVVTVNIPTAATGLQTMPSSTDPGTPTAGPSEAKTLTGTIG